MNRSLGFWLDSQFLYDLSFDYFSDLHGCHQVWLAYQNGVLICYFLETRLFAVDRTRQGPSNFTSFLPMIKFPCAQEVGEKR